MRMRVVVRGMPSDDQSEGMLVILRCCNRQTTYMRSNKDRYKDLQEVKNVTTASQCHLCAIRLVVVVCVSLSLDTVSKSCAWSSPYTPNYTPITTPRARHPGHGTQSTTPRARHPGHDNCSTTPRARQSYHDNPGHDTQGTTPRARHPRERYPGHDTRGTIPRARHPGHDTRGTTPGARHTSLVTRLAPAQKHLPPSLYPENS
ncbi:hypothetical protein Hamer_G024041 [Homarus americanus]|uniref:Uncharacterized protein n=1 Tax=Homarus americanus TaxID=6706 RepID=A0A8J5NDY2_HOMAM|nr:hypothetical protein Hamer_G024041 [Homarus americanus]